MPPDEGIFYFHFLSTLLIKIGNESCYKKALRGYRRACI